MSTSDDTAAGGPQFANHIRSVVLLLMMFGIVVVKAVTLSRYSTGDDQLDGHLLQMLLVTLEHSAPDHADIWDATLAAFPGIIPYLIGGCIVWVGIGYALNQSMIAGMSGAIMVDATTAPRLHRLTRSLCARAGMAMPHLAILNCDEMNAFASGMSSDQYTVTVTRGMMDAFDDEELEGVIAHELAHIRNNDVRLMVIAGLITGAIGLVANLIYIAITASFCFIFRLVRSEGDAAASLAGIGASVVGFVFVAIAWMSSTLISLALSRRREYLADAGAAAMTGKPDALSRGLEKLMKGDTDIGAPAAVMQMAITNPGRVLAGLFSTHPHIEDRIAALDAMPRRAPVKSARAITTVNGRRTGFGAR
jgi:heat shock protein HtpX